MGYVRGRIIYDTRVSVNKDNSELILNGINRWSNINIDTMILLK